MRCGSDSMPLATTIDRFQGSMHAWERNNGPEASKTRNNRRSLICGLVAAPREAEQLGLLQDNLLKLGSPEVTLLIVSETPLLSQPGKAGSS